MCEFPGPVRVAAKKPKTELSRQRGRSVRIAAHSHSLAPARSSLHDRKVVAATPAQRHAFCCAEQCLRQLNASHGRAPPRRMMGTDETRAARQPPRLAYDSSLGLFTQEQDTPRTVQARA